ncbi:MAG: hypothetical protein U5K27_05120 [Desulfotignum sp.]|nr:hypothetical protein [Desulfotignum sp.]
MPGKISQYPAHHLWIFFELGGPFLGFSPIEPETVLEVFLKALQSDIDDIQGGTTWEGIHLGAMAGSVNILQEAYLGIKTRGNILWVNPELPEVLEKLEMHV